MAMSFALTQAQATTPWVSQEVSLAAVRLDLQATQNKRRLLRSAMTPRPEPALRSGKASSGTGGTRRQNGGRNDGFTDDPPRTTTCSEDTSGDHRQSQEAAAVFHHRHHPLHFQHYHPQEQQQHDTQHQQTAPLVSDGAAVPIVSRSSSSASLPSLTAAAILPRVPSLADLEMGTTKKKKKQQNDETNNSQHSDAQATSTSAYRRRRRRKLRSFASFAPASSTRLRRRQSDAASDHASFFVPPTISIPLLNGIDMFAVSLVVPLLFQYYKSAGVSSAAQRELLSSLFSASQIVGGLLMGILTDANLVERKTILLLSFGGSAVSYALIAFGGLHALLLSRVLVGLVKQTMTVCTTILTYHTTREDRARGLGRLTASSTVAWVVGPTVGALLYRYVDPRAPALLACLLFVMNFVLATILIDRDHGHSKGTGDDEDNDDMPSSSSATKERANGGSTAAVAAPPTSKWRVIVNNLRCCFGSRALGSAVATKLLLTWITKATNYSQLGSFYEDMYNLQPHHRGYISSYQQLLQFVVNVRLITPVLEWAGGERMATLYCVGIMAGAVYLESLRSLSLFLAVLCPVIALSFSISDLSLQTLVTHVAPPAGMFSVLAALDVLQNAVSVSVPFYRTWLFSHLPADSSVGAMVGDPDPVAWVRASSLHWLLAAAILSVVLTREAWWKEDHPHHVTKAPAKKGK
jgi:MFS family permease